MLNKWFFRYLVTKLTVALEEVQADGCVVADLDVWVETVVPAAVSRQKVLTGGHVVTTDGM